MYVFCQAGTHRSHAIACLFAFAVLTADVTVG